MLKKTTILMAAILAGVFSLSGCGEEEKAAAPTAAAEEKPQTVEPIVIRVGHDAHPGEPFLRRLREMERTIGSQI